MGTSRRPGVQIEHRPASQADVPAMVELQRATWTEAFLDLLPPGFEMKPVEAWGETLRRALATDGVEALASETPDGLAGFVVFGANRDVGAEPDTGEIRALFVHPRRWRIGVGTALVAGAARGLSEMGYAGVTLWSLRDNDRANAFYVQLGFERDGTTQVRGDLGAPEVRYRRALPGRRYTF